ncbi:HAD family hydrolase [Prescottella equi]|uniref:HAD-IA family hydrolase n=1 Tax=Rhodococcus hoagii TaxID=43767 RepID=A0AAE5F3E7_RHOHA|nr:HAD family phosphatase [Prescottella equi]GBF16801.1 phosphorylated carbohydrates phosphatase [Rhodococcus sp. Br-6]ERN47662.1 haloacid dehalogenase-like hydrolase [Prescottella equi NBRC 101255 = C 7]MBM4525261.1 HAD-IA family hydrolase [Prescottella equi]MBM4627374.1 HAD-IA family hydrolase [Prescottella equi]MBM4651065.1 HAD-IA family hydrolase [Prescottella equi]
MIEFDTAVQAVLWDMDGTLVDTEPYWFRAETELLSQHGVPWSPEQATALVGSALPHSAAALQAAGVRLEIREIIDTLLDSVIKQVRTEVPWRPGARELLADVRSAGIPCAMVTMSERPLAAEIARMLPTDTFEFLVTGDMVTSGKPHPEPYLLAVETLQRTWAGVTHERVIAIEDSLPGLASAKASGVVTLGVPNMVPLPTDSGHTVWPTLAGRTAAHLHELVTAR